jgi:hypothetical protein
LRVLDEDRIFGAEDMGEPGWVVEGSLKGHPGGARGKPRNRRRL